MKQLFCLIIWSFTALFAASGAGAQDYRSLSEREGVEVMAAFDPLGPNNLIAAYVKFVNKNGYRVNIKWTPLIACVGQAPKEGYGESFSLDAGGTYEVNLWRSAACVTGSIDDLAVDMEVRKD